MKKVMISQPMRGKTNEQIRAERENIEKILRDEGFEVVDTIISEKAPANEDELENYNQIYPFLPIVENKTKK